MSYALGPLAGLGLYFLMTEWGHPSSASIVAGITVLCALWWALEPLPIPVTSLIPLAIFPLLGVLTKEQVAMAFGHHINLLMLGGFALSLAMEKSMAHKGLAQRLLKWVSGGQAQISGRRVLFGFMAVSALLSMWISNTAAAIMLLPMAIVVAKSASKDTESALMVPLLLAICYSASIGGLGTPIGTPPNLIFISVYEAEFGKEIGFLQWMTWALPVVFCMLMIAFWWLSRTIPREKAIELVTPQAMNSWQIRVLLVFLLTALGFLFRSEPFGGWQTWLGLPKASDASVALIAIILMCIVPRGGKAADKAKPLFEWEFAKDLPWGVLLLFSGGLAIASAFKASGLSQILAHTFFSMSSVLPVLATIALIALVVTFLTELTSNTATASLLMPLLASIAVGSGIDGMTLMLPAVLSTSFAFMMPVATPPNAVVFGSGLIPIKTMIRYGLVLNFFGASVVFIYAGFILN